MGKTAWSLAERTLQGLSAFWHAHGRPGKMSAGAGGCETSQPVWNLLVRPLNFKIPLQIYYFMLDYNYNCYIMLEEESILQKEFII
ncbi:hypothetical protein IMSAGC019_04142 [Lachnospiraceae bacterium]|nr:hypothetical protein IMSAGC019_04142 [Lachnospiraceae bacterium]